MNTVKLGDITIEVEEELTRQFYDTQNTFVCDCIDCMNYIANIPNVISLMNGIDKDLGIDLYKCVDQGMDELMPHDYEGSHLDVVPYYVIGKCYVNTKELRQLFDKPISTDQKNIHCRLTDDLSFSIQNTTDSIKIKDAKNVLTIWIEYKTEVNN